MPNFIPIGATTGVGRQKLKFLLRFDQNVEYKRPAGAYPLHDFHKICSVCTPFQDALGSKISLDLLEGLWSYGGFKLKGSGSPNFQCPLAAKLCVRPPKVLEVQTFLAIKHRRIFNVHLHVHVDVEELRAQASDSMLGNVFPSQMQHFNA